MNYMMQTSQLCFQQSSHSQKHHGFSKSENKIVMFFNILPLPAKINYKDPTVSVHTCNLFFHLEQLTAFEILKVAIGAAVLFLGEVRQRHFINIIAR